MNKQTDRWRKHLYGSNAAVWDADELEVPTMETRRRLLGLEHPETLEDMASVATNYWSQDKKSQAIQLLTEVVPKLQQNLGADHPSTIRSMHRLQKWQNEMEWSYIERIRIGCTELVRKIGSSWCSPESLAKSRVANSIRPDEQVDKLISRSVKRLGK